MGFFAVFEDVENSFEGTVPDSLRSYVETKIDEAETLLKTLVPGLRDIMVVTELQKANARRLICAAVLRVFRNPTGVQSQTSGPWSMTLSVDNATGSLGFTDEELSIFRSRSRKRIGMVGVRRPWYT
ncbi:Gp19/Gp15/Gp42 family protein [Rhodococcus sp. NPDC057297]|uniref:Gp19/Gp15/Gp42 family protein n=1 Tax=Rhodococcus sp. NPDC057297 TaxID=3346090 RepID=UPI0036313395